MITEFFLNMNPPTITHQEKKIKVVNGKPQVYEPAELKNVRAKLRAYLSKHVPSTPYLGATRLITKWLFPSGQNHDNGKYKITKPDTDNLQKLLKDVMEDLGFFVNDALVASEVIEKFWSDVPGIYIRLENLE